MKNPAYLLAFALGIAGLTGVRPASGAGARHFKSGPIQVTADGRYVWVVNPDHDSVSRIDTSNDAVLEVRLPAPGPHAPRGLSVREDGAEVWVACHDSDKVFVLRGTDGSVLATLDLPWGSGPYGVALARDQRRALVTLHRASALAVIETASRQVSDILEPVFWSPLGIAWMEDGVSAWVTHLFADGEDPFLTRVDFSGPRPLVTSRIIVKSTNPKQSTPLAPPYDLAEGGYLTFRGHLAQIPTASGRNEVWLPTQYNNINENRFTPDTTIQTTVRHLSLATRTIPNTNNDKVILTAVHVHDPQSSGGAQYVGPGWDARISGPVDLGFSSNGQTLYLLNEQSNDLVVMATSTGATRVGLAALPEITVGWRPMGLAVSPVADVAYVMNQLSRTVSVVDLVGLAELRQIPVTPATPEPFSAADLKGAKIFHASVDPDALGRISSNEKVACASCHPHAEHDGRIWDFESLPGNHGPRATMTLLGLARTFANGQTNPNNYGCPAGCWGELHRSGDRDEIQDFEHTFQGVNMGGLGFLQGAVNPELGTTNAGIDPDLDALKSYLLSLAPLRRSPARAYDGTLREPARRGATFFRGSGAGRADAQCGRCHDPMTGFVNFNYHDVGQRRPTAENELNNRTPSWFVNTSSLVGVWATPPYDGVATYANSLVETIKDSATRTSHGTTSGLTGRQVADLAEFVASIDGDMTGAEVNLAVDRDRPRIVRVEPASLTTVDVWFSETIDPVTSANPVSYVLNEVGQAPIAITGAVWRAQNGDRVTLNTSGLRADCVPVTYELAPASGSAIRDVADWASTNPGFNTLDPADPGNRHTFAIGPTLTVTLGASGYENIGVAVHDAGFVGPNLSTWGHDAPWLYINGTTVNKGFVRFDWRSAFAAVTGVTASSAITDASFSLQPEWGDAQTVRARRTLLSWADPASGGDWNQNPTNGPTWRDHQHPNLRWNQAGALAVSAGVDGQSVSDYNGANDVGAAFDAVVAMSAINERLVIGGAGVTDAYRFWFDNPGVDYGHALDLAPGATQESKFDRSETELGQNGPVLTVTYALPVTPGAAPGEVSGPGTRMPLRAVKVANTVTLYFEDLAPAASAYNVYEGAIGQWFSHGPAACGTVPMLGAFGRTWTLTPAAGSRYIQVTGANACNEGPTPAGWPLASLTCPP